MKPFDLNAALDGAKLVTKDGNPARLICADRQHQARFIWLEQDEKGPEYVATGTHEALCQALRLADDEPVKQAQTPRPHCELIHAWADGAEVQMLSNGEWEDAKTPLWGDDKKYRIKPKEWYENIPEHGRLCWVQDELHHEKAITIIVRYDNENRMCKFVSFRHHTWKYATPLTNDEIKQFLE